MGSTLLVLVLVVGVVVVVIVAAESWKIEHYGSSLGSSGTIRQDRRLFPTRKSGKNTLPVQRNKRLLCRSCMRISRKWGVIKHGKICFFIVLQAS